MPGIVHEEKCAGSIDELVGQLEQLECIYLDNYW